MASDTRPSTLVAWLLATRPKTLTAALVPVAVGTALAARLGSAGPWWVVACALGAAFAIQIATNLFNDALDHEKGTDTDARLGPTRAAQAGWIPASTLRAAAWASLVVALALAAPLVARGGWPIAVIAILSCVFAYGYTGGPFPLAYLGVADAFVIAFFGLIAVGGTVWLQAGVVGADAMVAGLQVGSLAAALLAVNNVRDITEDRAAGKRTLPARFGLAFGRAEVVTLIALPFALGAWWLTRGAVVAALLPCLATPLAWSVGRGVCTTEPSTAYNKLLARTAAVHLVFGATLVIGLAA